MKNIETYNIGDLVAVRCSGSQPIFAYTCLETFISCSHPGDVFSHNGDIGIVVEIPDVWGRGTGLIFGVLFHDKKKYLSCKNLKLLITSGQNYENWNNR